ncbi:MAG: XRE family transcriptional regulator [Flavobacterium sp.]|nr:MAG: XRE family transcriptional regulator [Flavobacterium sp.]
MLIFNSARIFRLKSIHRPFSHLVNMGYSTGSATKLSRNEIYSINLDRLEKFCREFNCTPNDVLDFRPDKNNTLPPDHALHSLTKKELSNEINEIISTLPIEKIQQIHDIIKNME